MSKTLYLECSSGIAGDMCAAALLDLGASEERLRAALATLPCAGEFELVVSRVQKNGLAVCDFDVRLDAEHENHDHDMEYLFGHLHGDKPMVGEGESGAASEHEHHHHHTHHHEHRTIADVTALINASQLTDRAKKIALAIFQKLAEGEAAAHGSTPDEVHFHEVGAVDSIVDVCSVAVCLDDLDVNEVVVTGLAEGTGTVRCAHGIMPIPVPAVANICSANGIVLTTTGVQGELVTPTGAAIVAACCTSATLPASYAVKSVGVGAGKRSYTGCSGVLRAMLIEPVAEPASKQAHSVVKLECDLDDCTGEAIGYTIELLMSAGAREAHATPIVMKKGRPGITLTVLCDAALEEDLERLIFENTTTIGIRSTGMHRTALPRRPGIAHTPFGDVVTKIVTLPGGEERVYPEYDSVVEACRRTGVSFQDVFRAAQRG